MLAAALGVLERLGQLHDLGQQVVHALGLLQRLVGLGLHRLQLALGLLHQVVRLPEAAMNGPRQLDQRDHGLERLGDELPQHRPSVPRGPQNFTLYSRWMRTFRRLLGFLRPYRRSLIFSLLLAWAAMGMTVVIPCWSAAPSTRSRSRSATTSCRLRWPLLGAGLLRLALTVGRRLIAGKVSLAVEYDLRQRFYEHLQKLELAFFDSPADRAADVAGDGGPAVDPLLPRLRPDLDQPEPPDDPLRGGGDDRDRSVARAAGAGARSRS